MRTCILGLPSVLSVAILVYELACLTSHGNNACISRVKTSLSTMYDCLCKYGLILKRCTTTVLVAPAGNQLALAQLKAFHIITSRNSIWICPKKGASSLGNYFSSEQK